MPALAQHKPKHPSQRSLLGVNIDEAAAKTAMLLYTATRVRPACLQPGGPAARSCWHEFRRYSVPLITRMWHVCTLHGFVYALYTLFLQNGGTFGVSAHASGF